jgi:excisionase family DNA binding protein
MNRLEVPAGAIVEIRPIMIVTRALEANPEMQSNGLFSVEAAADRIGVTVQTIQRWCRRGVLPYVRIETLREFRFDRATLDKWIAERNGYYRGKKKIG